MISFACAVDRTGYK